MNKKMCSVKFTRLYGAIALVVICGMYLHAQASNTGAQTITGTTSLTSQTITASTADESGILVKSGSVATITNCTITTTSISSNNDSSSFYGKDAGILVESGGKIASLTGTKVTCSGTGANGVFAYGTGTIVMSNDTINCTGQYGHGIMCSGGGTITVTDCYAKTTKGNSGCIATDRGSGTITVTGGYYEAAGNDAPGIYSTGNITVTGATVKGSASEAVVIEGLNKTILNNVTLSGGVSTYGGVLVVQSGSGDASNGTATFTMTGGSFTVTSGPMFFVTHTEGALTLKNVTASITSGILIKAAATSRWGTQDGTNGGHVNFTVDSQTLVGNVLVDSISYDTMTLKNSSFLTGHIDSANKAKSVVLTMDATSKWIVTADSHIGKMVDAGISGTTASNITGNNHNVYYDSSLSTSLVGKTYSLTSGGCLLPEGKTCSVTGVMENDQARAISSASLLSLMTATGHVVFSPLYSGKTKIVCLYNLVGKQLSVKTFKKNEVNVRADFGVSDEIYIVKIIGIN